VENFLRIRITPGFWTSRVGLAILGSVLLLFIICTSVFAYYYVKFGKLIDERLSGTIYQNTSRVFSAPSHIYTGEKLTAAELSTYLLHAGYQEGAPRANSKYKVRASRFARRRIRIFTAGMR